MSHSPHIAAAARVLPPHRASQDALTAALRAEWAEHHFNVERLEELHRATRVENRHLALPLDAYPRLRTFKERNDAFIEVAQGLAERALHDALKQAELAPDGLRHLFFATVTGVAVPSIDARLVNRLGLRTDVKRTPLFGLGCVAGAAGLARASDVLRAFPNEHAALVSVELCSLTLQREDTSVANVIASGLFGDGAAAVVLRGGQAGGGGPQVVATRSVFYPGTERVVGWDVVDGGFKVVLSPKVPQLVLEHLRGNVDAFLAAQGLQRGDIRHWVAHTGGPKVLDAFQTALELPPGALERSHRSLREVGNLSSASVLFVLADLLERDEARPGDLGLLLAMGPGFCSELVLLRW